MFKMIKRILTSVGICLIAVFTASMIQTYAFKIGNIPSESMYPTLQIGDYVFSTRLYSDELERGSIIIFHPNPDQFDSKELWIKRLIGLPGDRIKIQDGVVYVNGEVLDEPYVKNVFDSNDSFVVPENRYFVLGDNRTNSLDSRFWDISFLRREQILYKCKAIIFPFSRFKIFD